VKNFLNKFKDNEWVINPQMYRCAREMINEGDEGVETINEINLQKSI